MMKHNFFRNLYLVLFLLSCLANSGISQEKPRLVIDPQGHSSLVKRLLFTPDGERLISLGFDKTIRIWDVESGLLVDSIRLEIGEGDAGKHFAGDISPDGRYLAVGGWATQEGKYAGRIRVIDLVTQEVAAVLRGHLNVVSDLAFSPDGSVLVSSSSDSAIRVWDAKGFGEGKPGEALDITKAQSLKGHSGSIYEVEISKDGNRIVSAASDKTIKIWERNGAGSAFSLKKTLTGHPDAITALGLLLDGNRIVSGDAAGNLYFWDLAKGVRIKELEQNLENQVGTLRVSPDGKSLLVSSQSGRVGKTVIIDGVTAKVLFAFDKHDNSVFASAWHPTKNLVATTGGNNYDTYLWRPSAAGGSQQGDVVHEIRGVGLSVFNVGFSQNAPLLTVLGVMPPKDDWLPSSPLSYVLNFSSLTFKPLETAEEAATFQTVNWGKDGAGLFFENGGIKIPTRGFISNSRNKTDALRTGTLTPDGKDVIAGSSFYLLRFSKSGNSFKEVTNYVGHEADINAVSVSPDGKYLISGSMDQTARLWNLKSGALLASFFLARDGEWVCWTPDGYFSASPGGGELIGWHFNRGLDKVAEFISGDQLYDHFFRPDIVKKTILENRPSSEIVKELGIVFDLEDAMKGSPGIAFLEPAGNITASQRRLAVKVQAADEGGGIGEVQVFHEGKRLQPDGPGSFRDGKYEVPFTVSLISGNNEVKAVAVNPDGVESPPQVIRVKYEGTKASAKLHLLAVGLNQYKNKKFNLNYCRPDVDAFADSFSKGSGKLFAETVVHKLYDEEATSEGISDKLKEIASVATADDVFVFAFAGHGVMSEGEGDKDSEFYIIPYDVTQMYGNDEMLAERALSGSQLQQMAAKIPARKQLMVLDACQSGGVVESFAVRGAAEEKALAQLARSSGMYVLASTRSEQFATETAELGHGLFTFALLEALEGKGDGNGDGKITVKEVEAWLNERVPELSEKHTGTAQYPNSFARGQDFPIGVTGD